MVETNDGRSRVVFGDPQGLGETINFLDLDGTNGFVIEHKDPGRNVRAGLGGPTELGFRRGDFNGDGVADLLLEVTGMPADTGYDREGYIVFGGGDTTAASLTLNGESTANVVRITATEEDSLQPTFSAISDYNGDGIDDIRFLDKVIYGGADLPAQLDADSLDPEAGRELAYAATDIGDMNGDGMPDYYLPGHSAVLFDTASGLPETIDAQTLDGSNGFRLSSSSGPITSVAGIGDFNGDGLADLATGVPEDDRVSILYGRDDGFAAEIDPADLAAADGVVLTGGLQGSLGDKIAPAGDVNGDGLNDVLISQSGFVSGHIDALVLYGTEEALASPLAARNRPG
ncbi:MAG: hypothetical protein U5P41_02075 [Gammaproteobacteria bacterium]|nr:hypothetical protein [Gammaproteobacteria bacterium]